MPQKKKKSSVALDVTQVLHQDHQKVRELFFQFHETEDSEEKKELVKEIITELYVHSTVEEEIVYPALQEEVEEGEELAGEAETEHLVVKFLMAELANMSPEEELFESKVTVLCELVNHHIKEEEKEIFRKMRESGADLEELAVQVVDRKQELQGKPLPSMHSSISFGSNGTLQGEQGEEAPAKRTKGTRAR